MPDGRALMYIYDGSFDGLMCCVFESYDKKEMPMDIAAENAPMTGLLPAKTIETDARRAERVTKSIREKIGYKAFQFIRRAFLTCHPNREVLILQFLRLGFKNGSSVMDMLTDTVVHELKSAVLHLDREANHYLGFIRFSESSGALTAQIEPKNYVLPLIGRHFCGRYPGEDFLIYDRTHAMALVHQDGIMTICGAEDFEQPSPDEEESRYRRLWRLFYETIEIKERHNPRCRMGHMPKRYWNCMTEFAQDAGNKHEYKL